MKLVVDWLENMQQRHARRRTIHCIEGGGAPVNYSVHILTALLLRMFNRSCGPWGQFTAINMNSVLTTLFKQSPSASSFEM